MTEQISPEHIEFLLPFYLNGTLSDNEKEAVEEALEQSVALREELAFLQQIQSDVKSYEPAQTSPGELGLKRLQRQINSQANTAGNTTKWRFVAIAASCLLVLQTTLIGLSPSTELYLPAGGKPTTIAVNKTIFRVAFDPMATEASIRSLLLDLDAQIIEGPSAIGLYVVSTEQTEEDALNSLQSHTIVESVQIIK